MSIANRCKFWRWVLCVVIFATVARCHKETGQEAFFSLHRSEMERRFQQLSLKEQYEILMVSRSRPTFPRFVLVELIVEREDSLPFFQARLRSAAEEGEIEDLLNIFLNLAERGALQGKKDVWELLKMRTALVRTLRTRRACLYSLHEIEQHMKYKTFFFRPSSGPTKPEQQRDEFRSLPLEAQLEVCLLALSTEPPRTEFADYIAERGSVILPMLVAVLKTDYYERATPKIFYLIELLSQKGALCGRNDVMDVLKDRADIVPDHKVVQGSYHRILEAVSRCQTTPSGWQGSHLSAFEK